jgi:hypothetical protein
MRMLTTGYYEIFGYNSATASYDKWLGTATAAEASKIGSRIKLGSFIGYSAATADGWACKARR